MRKYLTPKQRNVYDYICSYIEQNGYSPSYYEIRDYLGLASVSTVATYIYIIEKKGWLKRSHERRNLRPVRERKKTVQESVDKNKNRI